MQTKRFLISAVAALGLFFLGLSALGLSSSASAAGISPLIAGPDQTAISGKSSVTQVYWRGGGWRGGGWGGVGAGAGAARAGVEAGAAAGVGPLVQALLASD